MCCKPRVPITKASMNFVGKFCWSMVQTMLRPTGNVNTLQPSHAYLVACLMAMFGVNVGYIIATKMQDGALFDRAGMPFSCLIRGICKWASVSTTHHMDKGMALKGMVKYCTN